MPFNVNSSPGLTATKLELIKLSRRFEAECKVEESNAIIASLHCSNCGISSAGA